MRTITVRDCRYLKQESSLADYRFNFLKPIERFQKYIETSEWDQKLIGYSGKFDKICLYIVICLMAAYIPFLLKIS